MIPIKYFVARDAEIEKIKEKFKKVQFFLINGKSGSGKTTLARHFIEENRNDITIWWITCPSIKMRLLSLAEKLMITNTHTNFEDLVNSIRFALGNKNVLFVLDNFDVNSEEQKDTLRIIINNNLQFNIKFLITAISDEVNEMFTKNFDQLRLDLFSKNDCLSLILKQVNKSSLNENQIDKIIDKVEYLPIKIDRLVAKIKKMKHSTYEDLLKEIDKDTLQTYEILKTNHPLEYKLLTYLSLIQFEFN